MKFLNCLIHAKPFDLFFHYTSGLVTATVSLSVNCSFVVASWMQMQFCLTRILALYCGAICRSGPSPFFHVQALPVLTVTVTWNIIINIVLEHTCPNISIILHTW